MESEYANKHKNRNIFKQNLIKSSMIASALTGIFYQFGSFADLFYTAENFGIFEIILPFLLVFAIVYGILSATNILGKNPAVSVIIAVSIGLMSLRYRFFLSDFLSELFPRLGIGLGVLLAVLILVGLFVTKEQSRYWSYILAGLGGIIALVVLYQTFGTFGYFSGYSSDIVGFIIIGVLLLIIIIAVTATRNPEAPGLGTWPWDRSGGVVIPGKRE